MPNTKLVSIMHERLAARAHRPTRLSLTVRGTDRGVGGDLKLGEVHAVCGGHEIPAPTCARTAHGGHRGDRALSKILDQASDLRI
jgi:hypothetical protein